MGSTFVLVRLINADIMVAQILRDEIGFLNRIMYCMLLKVLLFYSGMLYLLARLLQLKVRSIVD